MAEAALLGLATNAAMAMGQLIQARAVDEMKLAWGLKDELEKLKTKFSDLQAFLKDVGSAKHADKRSQVNDWLQKVKDAAYFADDIMDDYDYEILRRELEQNKRFMKQFGAFFTHYNPIIFRIRMSHKVSNALAMFDELDKKAHIIGLKQVDITRDGIGGTWADDNDGSLSLSQARQLAAADAAEFVGRKDDEEKLLQMLCHPTNHEHNISIVAIVGLGGLGKTTFARRLYESDQVHAHFEKRLWICVSENFTIPRILNEMVELVTSKKGDLSNIDAIIKKLQESLKNYKYLLVLDDVWCTDQELWNSLKNTLQRIGGLPGSVILVTTRINEVATRSRAVSTHFLKGLSEQESWELLKQKAFAGASSLDVSSLEEVGKRIAAKCEGVPLAIKAIGGILQLKQYPHEWEAIQKSDVWDLPQNDQNQILPSLRLTFNHLPSSALKQCFAYCAVFLKDYYLEKDELVNIWLAQGFLHESQTRNLTMEETGEEYLKVLQNYSLLEVMADDDDEDDGNDDDGDDDDDDDDNDDDNEDDDDDESSDDDSDGDELKYTMHDLVHDLAVDSSGEDLLLWKPKDHHKIDNCRHLVIDPKFVEALSQLPITKTLRKLRTITYGFPPNVLAHAKYLRTLLVDDQGIKEVPPSIGLLKHLRYFSVSHNPIKTLPDSIGKLYLLQTLRLLGCGSMEVLPKVLYRLVKLIHIPTTTSMLASRGLLQLTELQTLPHLALGDDGDGWSVDELGSLHKLTGEIHISGLERVKTKDNAKEADLAGKAKVSKITLAWAKDREEVSGGNCDEDVLDGLQPHPNITSLELQNFYGQMFPSWIMRMAVVTKEGSISTPLKNLTSFKLLNCSRCKTFPTLGQLPFLKYLTLNGLRVECIGNDFYVTSIYQSNRNVNKVPFPSLIELEISDCQVLKTWVLPASELAPTVLPRLEVLRVTGCPKLKTLPALDFQFLRKLELQNLGIQSLDITKHSSLFTSPKVNLMLETLKISKCEKLVSIPSELQYVASLKTIRVLDCPALVSLPDDIFHGLSFLSKLSICKCEMLSNIPSSLEECLSLKKLRINYCPSIMGPTPDFSKLKGLRELCKRGNSINLMNSMLEAIRHLPHLLKLVTGKFKDEDEQNTYFSDLGSIQQSQSLTELYLDGHPNVKSLPEQLQLLTGLKILVIRNYDNLEQFPEWVARLSSLEELWLGWCKKLKCLPSKEVFSQLNRLKELRIKKCPILSERCHKDDGPEWSKISHIPYIEIDDKTVQNLS